jgi:hypothetical protein
VDGRRPANCAALIVGDQSRVNDAAACRKRRNSERAEAA